MSLIATPLPANGPQVTALQNALIALGFTFPSAELGSPGSGVFGPVTQAAVRSFRLNMGLPQLAPTESPFDAAAARLLNVVVPANGTVSSFLSAAVRESLAAAQGAAPLEIEWLARYATIARDFTAARQAAALAPNDTVIATTIVQPVIGDASFQAPNPEVQNPENFFTCRYDFVPQPTLDALLGRPAAPGGSSPRVLLARRRPAQQAGPDDWPDVPAGLLDPPPPPPDTTTPHRIAAIQTSAAQGPRRSTSGKKGIESSSLSTMATP
jgi:peptidoglycan hydrolase-like protein with peptidoglycan-binding domain